MKKLLMLIMLSLPIATPATDLSVIYIDTINSGDTAIATVRLDTVFTPILSFAEWRYMQFYVDLQASPPNAGGVDTNWATDTFFINVQHSFDRTNWVTVEVDTLFDAGTGVPVLNFDKDATIVGPWLRGMFIHKDSLEASGTALVDNTYSKNMVLYINGSY